MDNKVNEKRLLMGVIFLMLGGFLLVGNLHLLPYPIYRNVKDWFWHWPMILIVIGLVHFILKEPKFRGVVMILIGTIFMMPHWVDFSFNYREIFWPILFIIIGFAILFRGQKRSHHHHFCREELSQDQDLIDDFAFFGGGDRIVTSQKFKGGKITCIFGGLNFNFLRAKLSQEKNVIDIFAVFGGTKLIIPEDWDVKINVTSVLGGIADKRNISPSALENIKGELIIRGMVIFGGGEIKNF